MFAQVKKLLHLFDMGLIDEAGLARGLAYEATHRPSQPSSRR